MCEIRSLACLLLHLSTSNVRERHIVLQSLKTLWHQSRILFVQANVDNIWQPHMYGTISRMPAVAVRSHMTSGLQALRSTRFSERPQSVAEDSFTVSAASCFTQVADPLEITTRGSRCRLKCSGILEVVMRSVCNGNHSNYSLICLLLLGFHQGGVYIHRYDRNRH